jgi:hypothetical protein
LIEFFKLYIDEKINAAAATALQEPEVVEGTDNLTIQAIFVSTTTQGYITLVSFGNTFAEVVTFSEASQFALNSNTLRSIAESVRKVEASAEPTPIPTIIVLPTNTPTAPPQTPTTETTDEATGEATEEAEGTPVGYRIGNDRTLMMRVIPNPIDAHYLFQGGTPTPPVGECSNEEPLILEFNAEGELEIPLLSTDCVHFFRLILDDRFPEGDYALQLGNQVIEFSRPLQEGQESQELAIFQGDGTIATITILIEEVGTGPILVVTTPAGPQRTPDPFELTSTALVGISPPTATTPSELPQGGFFDDLSSGGSSGLILLALLGGGLVAIAVVARQLRLMGQDET